MKKNRLEAFSDGVIAIIITIMILKMKQPHGDKLKDLLTLWPIFLTYLISYLFVAIYWVNHHLIFQMTEEINIKILWCNVAWLFIMSFIPVATEWVGTYPSSFVPITLYFTVMFFACIVFHLMYYLILQQKGEKYKMSPKKLLSIGTYFIVAVFGGFYPFVAFILVALITCWWIVPEKKRKK